MVASREWIAAAASMSRALLLLLALAYSVAGEAQAGDNNSDPGLMSGLYSYLPPMPNIRLPDINIPFWTDDLKKAKRAYQAGNYPKALTYFRRASDDGNIVADWYLGHMYRLGRGVPKDDATAFSYYSRVADQYDPDEPNQNRLRVIIDAMVHVADYQRTGSVNAGIQPDPTAAAATYMNIATTYGHPAALYALGVMNIKGQGMRANPQQGLKWLIAAARKRNAPAEAYLGELYWQGQLVQPDRTRAVMWYLLAQQSAREDENPEIFARSEQLMTQVTEDERLEASARAKVWDEQYPLDRRVAGPSPAQ
jgi:TPR repeat protein